MFQSAGILSYFEELKHDPNTEIGPKDIFKMASSNFLAQ
jgi:preprotein translocase subunit Sec61beta